MRNIIATTLLASMVSVSPVLADSPPTVSNDQYNTVIDQPIGDDIGWTHEIFLEDINQDNNMISR